MCSYLNYYYHELDDIPGFNVVVYFVDEQNLSNQKSLKQLRIPSRGDETIDDVENQESIVKIMVESPKDPPNSGFVSTFPVPTMAISSQEPSGSHSIQVSEEIGKTDDQIINEPIDVNVPYDTSNLFYAYEGADEPILTHPAQQIADDDSSTNGEQSSHKIVETKPTEEANASTSIDHSTSSSMSSTS